MSSYPVNGVTPSVPRIPPSRACVREGLARSSVEVVHLRPEHDHEGHDHDPEDCDDHLEVRFDDHRDREQAANRQQTAITSRMTVRTSRNTNRAGITMV